MLDVLSMLLGLFIVLAAYVYIRRRQDKIQADPGSVRPGPDADLERRHRASLDILHMTVTNDDSPPFDDFVRDADEVENAIRAMGGEPVGKTCFRSSDG